VPGVDEGRRRYPRPRRPLRLPYSLGRAHFVGRDGEYALLAERLREAMGGSGGAVAVEGEAGIGKTRLVEEFLGYAGSRGALVLAGRCYERELGPPLEPISDALGPLPAAEEPAPGFFSGRNLVTGGRPNRTTAPALTGRSRGSSSGVRASRGPGSVRGRRSVG
jgi:hypothetical protein